MLKEDPHIFSFKAALRMGNQKDNFRHTVLSYLKKNKNVGLKDDASP